MQTVVRALLHISSILSFATFSFGVSMSATAQVPVQDANRYQVVFHHEIEIERSAKEIWPWLIRLDKWIEFDFISVSGERYGEGEVVQLYAGQDFYYQTIKMIPNKLLVGVNLPNMFKGEQSSGIAITALTEFEGTTVVTVTASRQYLWTGTGVNPLRIQRESDEFRANTTALWEERFLPNLRRLVLDNTRP